MMKKCLTVAAGLCLWLAVACEKKEADYKNPDLPVETRVNDLLKRMTLEEKFWQLYLMPGDLESLSKEQLKHGIFGLQIATGSASGAADKQMLQYDSRVTAKVTAEKINAVQKFFVEETRLGIPIIAVDEALHGLVREGATSFPQSIALAATFDTTLMRSVSAAIARECKTRGIRQVLSPVVNLASDVRWGRTEETYGEDPYLSACMGVAFVRSFEETGIITTPKHFVANVGEGGRDSYPIPLSERALEETHYVPFKACFQEGKATSVMTAYNTLDGSPCSASAALLRDKLENEWGFEGFSISDADAVNIIHKLHHTVDSYGEAGADAINNGLDVIFQVDYDEHIPFLNAFRDGMVSQAAIDNAVRRVLRAKFRLGLFENPYVDPEEAVQWNGTAQHRQLSLDAARKSIVLLKNDHTLPLSKSVRNIAVIGEDAAEARLGGYCGPGINKVSILQAIEKKMGATARIHHAPGCQRIHPEHVIVPSDHLSYNGKKGLQGEYFSNIRWEGTPAMVRIDDRIQFRWTLFSPHPDLLDFDWYSARWTGKLTAPVSGRYEIGIEGNDGYTLYIDGKPLIERIPKVSYRKTTVPFTFEKGKSYDIRVDFYENTHNGRINLVWNVGCESEDSSIREAVEAARRSDVAIVAVGIEEGEFRDRAMIHLPGRQEELILRVAATGVPTVVVIVGGSAVTMESWFDRVPAIVDAWYLGDEGGTAVGDILFGDCNPSGKLPVTFPITVAQLPLTYRHLPTGRSDEYVNLTGEPLFAFGHGLSYTTFEYSQLSVSPEAIRPDGKATVTCRIKNTGAVKGEEVAQLYLHDQIADVAVPTTKLCGFQRIELAPGEEKTVRFMLDSSALEHLNVNMQRVVEPGQFRVTIGSSSKDIRLRGFLEVKKP
ncbi:MAG: glycoside hydrolase family 3 C-terminal domain-containing protein [Bacteroidales bacterium]|jgi:beta-glucosidase|nr:glycoside hydrolase family 3 C-terminal domain-containing protein [Bacteroidales bacterium]